MSTQTNPTESGRRKSPIAGRGLPLLAFGACILALLGWVGWQIYAGRESGSRDRTIAISGPVDVPAGVRPKSLRPPVPVPPPPTVNPGPVAASIRLRVPPAVINLYAPANAPARPADPAFLAASLPSASSQLRDYIINWEDSAARGGSCDLDPAAPELLSAIDHANLPCATFCELGGSIGFVAGEKSAVPFYRAAITSAANQFRGKRPGTLSPDDRAVFDLLFRVGDLQLNGNVDYEGAAKLYRLLMDVEIQGSQMGRRVLWRHCEALDRGHGNMDETIAPLRQVLALPEQAMSGDERLRFHLALGRALLAQEKFGPAAGEFALVTTGCAPFMDSDHAYAAPAWEQAHVLLVRALARAGRLDAAKAAYAKWKATYPGAAAGPLASELAREIEAAPTK